MSGNGRDIKFDLQLNNNINDDDDNDDDDDDDDDNNNNKKKKKKKKNNNHIERRSSRFFTISSLRREPSSTRTLKCPERNRVPITCSTSSVYHEQHVVQRDSSTVHLSVAVRTIVLADPSLGCIRHVAGMVSNEEGKMCVGWLTPQQHASVSQGRICTDNFTCCHTEIEAADQTFHLTQPQYTNTGPTSPSTDPKTPGAWQGSPWSANF